MRIRLLKGKRINGESYGPGYPESEVDVEEKIARHYLQTGAAVLVVEQELPPVGTLNTMSIADAVQERDPKHRRGKR